MPGKWQINSPTIIPPPRRSLEYMLSARRGNAQHTHGEVQHGFRAPTTPVRCIVPIPLLLIIAYKRSSVQSAAPSGGAMP